MPSCDRDNSQNLESAQFRNSCCGLSFRTCLFRKRCEYDAVCGGRGRAAEILDREISAGSRGVNAFAEPRLVTAWLQRAWEARGRVTNGSLL